MRVKLVVKNKELLDKVQELEEKIKEVNALITELKWNGLEVELEEKEN